MNTSSSIIKAPNSTKELNPMAKIKCPHCNYEWESRKEKPKKCPLCIRWINKPVPKPK